MTRPTNQRPAPVRQRMPVQALPPASAELRQRALAACTLGALSLVGLAFIGNLRRASYVVAVALVFAVIAIWLGVSASKQARRSRTARPRTALAGTVLGGFGLAFSLVWIVMLALFWHQLTRYASCLDGANTLATQQACQDQFTNSIDSKISLLRSGR